MGVEASMKDFQGGFIAAGGDAAEARRQAPQFAAASLAGDIEAALADPVVGAYVRAVAEAFPAPLEGASLRIPEGSDLGREAAHRWLLGEGLAKQTERGLLLNERGYARLCEVLATQEPAAGSPAPTREQRQADRRKQEYREARRLGNALADLVDESGVRGYRARLEAFWIALTQTLGLHGLTELRHALTAGTARQDGAPWHD